MNKARRFVYLSLYCMLIVTCFSIGIFCLSSRTINSYYEIYYTYTPSTLSKSLLQQYLTDNPTITEVYFNAFDSEGRTSFTIDETTYQTSDCVLLGDTSENDDESVLAYTDSQATKMYILCTEKITFPVNCAAMFQGYSALTKIEFENIDTKNVTNLSAMVKGCSSLMSLTFPSDLDTSKLKNMADMFYGCSALTSVDLTPFNTEKVTSMNGMFFNCVNLSNLNISSFDTSMVKYMQSMFYGCKSFTSLDLSHFNTTRVIHMSTMFCLCTRLTELNITSFETQNVTKMDAMFDGCNKLASLDLSNFNTSNVTDMRMMFYACISLKSLDISNFKTSKVTNMHRMFDGVPAQEIDVSSFDTSNVTDMSHMFLSCRNLKTLDLSGFNTANVTKIEKMFYNCSSLENIYIGKGWNLSSLIKESYYCSTCGAVVVSDQNMFYGCTSLPNFNSSYTGKTYAHAGTGGYLTYKSE